MSLVVLLGGARSGKSALALELASAAGAAVMFVATAEALDDEMSARIATHRAERPGDWATVEEPLELEGALDTVDPAATCVVDCLTLWVSNLLLRGDDVRVVAARGAACAAQAAARPGLTIAVSNEVGLGIVPATPLGRTYRDALGAVNKAWVGAAKWAGFVVAGKILQLDGADELVRSYRERP
ncbi:MAG TPA: bifunctional adenosylcobinamide kinase/adenosylcobinamide-phosphate guanylyltransferase [Gaiella sp.]|jgi:adenosyl cobinamide kinase/adenosyl cobinamide phosphate guanylyltransferase